MKDSTGKQPAESQTSKLSLAVMHLGSADLSQDIGTQVL